jgi:serine/threonine protein phosphatase PrpC
MTHRRAVELPSRASQVASGEHLGERFLCRALKLNVGQFSHPGRQRSNNEDWLGTFQPDDADRLEQLGSLFVVADGMGGHQSGELASRFAVDHVIRAYVDDLASDVGASLRRSIETANAALYAESDHRREQGAGRGWGTTLVAAVVRGDEVWIANVGDSRAYLLRNGRLCQLSEDHVLFPSGMPGGGGGVGRHVITRALGRKPAVEVDVFPPRKLVVGDRVLLCSDGLTTPLTDGEMGQIATHPSPQKAAEALVKAANDRGGPDNVSVILFEVLEGESAPARGALRSPMPHKSLLGQGSFAATACSAVQDIWLTLTDPRFWRRVLEGLERSLPGSKQQSRTLLLIVLIVLMLLILVGLGFILGMVLL